MLFFFSIVINLTFSPDLFQSIVVSYCNKHYICPQPFRFGKSQYDCVSCLAPVRQCCMIRHSTLAKLIKFYQGPTSLSQMMRASLATDALNPILLEPHLDALDRRLSKILHVIHGCLKNGAAGSAGTFGRRWEDVVIDDGVT